jgi:WD40 repeat protein
VNALEFSPFDSRLLASGGADNLVKIWMLPSEEMYEDIVNDSSTFNTSDSIITCLRFHPSADKILASSSIKDVFLYDLTTEETIYHLRDLHEAQITGLTWNYDGSLLISGSQDKKLRMFDPRNDSQSVRPFEAHTGKRGFNVVWCGRLEHFLTFGHDNMQEREVKLWDPRNLSRHVARERIDSCVGSLLPVYDDDINLVYLAGKGDSSIRCLEIDSNKPFLHSLDHIALSNTCMAIAMVPKQQLDTNKCEVGRILMLSQGAVEPLSFQVPRKDAVHTFQNDLYPDTKAFKSAMIGNDWKQNRNQEPLVEKVNPTEKHDDPVSLSSGVGGGSVWITTGGGWDALSTAGSESCTAGWGRESTRISTTEAIIETPKEAHNVLHPTKSKDSEVHQVEQQEQPPRRESMNVNIELSDKAKRLGSIYSHKASSNKCNSKHILLIYLYSSNISRVNSQPRQILSALRTNPCLMHLDPLVRYSKQMPSTGLSPSLDQEVQYMLDVWEKPEK